MWKFYIYGYQKAVASTKIMEQHLSVSQLELSLISFFTINSKIFPFFKESLVT